MKNKQTILVDMDGVLADVYQSYFKYIKETRNEILTEADCMGKEERTMFPDIITMLTNNHFFRHVPVMKDSIDGLRYLNNKYNVVIVSSATEFPNCMDDKQAWLNEHFPFIAWQQMIFCGSKTHVRGDIMIDDHPKNLSHFDGKRIIFNQPHNSLIKDSSYIRVNGWKEIQEIL